MVESVEFVANGIYFLLFYDIIIYLLNFGQQKLINWLNADLQLSLIKVGKIRY